MLDSFVGINEAEKLQLLDAIAQITVLVAGADGTIDTAEVSWAQKLAKIRTYANEDILSEYYGFVGDDFEDKLNTMIQELPDDVKNRNTALEEKLGALNPILAKMDNLYSSALYESFISFAEHVAKASGGFMRMWNVSSEEKKVMNLPMITPIERIAEEEEE